MMTLDIAALVNLLGWVVGFALYSLLLVMTFGSVRRRDARYGFARNSDRLPLATALLGLLWNAGALIAHDWQGQRAGAAAGVVGAVALAALGFLPAVVVHSAVGVGRSEQASHAARRLTFAAYALSGVAGAWHLYRAFTSGVAGSSGALRLLTLGYASLMVGLFVLTRKEPGARRAIWAAALAVFAVSALHLGGAGGENHERWYLELVGHHASLPLALAILMQDYRFAFADLFLKRALALVLLVGLNVAALAAYLSVFAVTTDAGGLTLDARALATLLALWTTTALIYPWLKRSSARLVDQGVLRRFDYGELRVEIARLAQTHEETAGLLDDVCARLRSALTARAVWWHDAAALHEPRASAHDDLITIRSRGSFTSGAQPHANDAQPHAVVRVPVTEAPFYQLHIGELIGGRRLLSDDLALLEWVALTLARRIDALRHTHERCVQDRRAEETAKLVSEAQLRALRAQINPHFLFNALTTIGYLIQTSPERALATLMRLTDLLRRVLRAPVEWVSLDEELRLVEAYLDIERARFEERLRFSFDVPEELRDSRVPSLVIQPLVENAIKHGIAPQRAGGTVTISARRVGDALKITVADTGAGATDAQFARGQANGVGLENVEQRLRLCCGDAAVMTIESRPSRGTVVELSVPSRAIVPAINGRAPDIDLVSANTDSVAHRSGVERLG